MHLSMMCRSYVPRWGFGLSSSFARLSIASEPTGSQGVTRRSELHLWSFLMSGTLLWGYLEHWLFMEPEHIGKDIPRECLDCIVQLFCC